MIKVQWVIEPINNGETYQITTSENKGFGIVCETLGGTEWDKTNTRLISAAPDLLAALEMSLNHMTGIPKETRPNSLIDIVSAAIKKSRAES